MITEHLVRTTIATPIGELTLVASDHGLRAVLWPDDDPARARLDTGALVVNGDAEANEHLRRATAQLGEYFAGERTEFDLALDPVGTEFQLEAWRALREIPFDSVATYGDQAAVIGDRSKARAVGAANGRNPLSIVVPCHRVVGSDGSLTGFAGGVDTKAWLLDHERTVLASTP